MSAPTTTFRYVRIIQALPNEPRRPPRHYRPVLPHERRRQSFGLVILALLAAIGACAGLAMDPDGWGGIAAVILGLSVPVKLLYAMRLAE